MNNKFYSIHISVTSKMYTNDGATYAHTSIIDTPNVCSDLYVRGHCPYPFSCRTHFKLSRSTSLAHCPCWVKYALITWSAFCCTSRLIPGSSGPARRIMKVDIAHTAQLRLIHHHYCTLAQGRVRSSKGEQQHESDRDMAKRRKFTQHK